MCQCQAQTLEGCMFVLIILHLCASATRGRDISGYLSDTRKIRDTEYAHSDFNL